MGWFNYYGLVIIALFMIPNIILSVTKPEFFINYYNNKGIAITEQIGRFGCFFCMIINVPSLYLDFWAPHALLIYLVGNGVLVFFYLIVWAIMWNKNCLARALLLSIIPTIIFLFSGIMVAYFPLIVLSIIFGIGHITLSYKNYILAPKEKELAD